MGLKFTSHPLRILGHVPQLINFPSPGDIVFTWWFSPVTHALIFPKRFCFNTCDSSIPPQTSRMHLRLLSSGNEAAIFPFAFDFCLSSHKTCSVEGGAVHSSGDVSGPGEQVLAPCRGSRRTCARGGLYKEQRTPAM